MKRFCAFLSHGMVHGRFVYMYAFINKCYKGKCASTIYNIAYFFLNVGSSSAKRRTIVLHLCYHGVVNKSVHNVSSSTMFFCACYHGDRQSKDFVRDYVSAATCSLPNPCTHPGDIRSVYVRVSVVHNPCAWSFFLVL